MEIRVDRAEDLLASGISAGRVERALANEFRVTPRQARTYISRVYDRWRKQTSLDAPHRREKLFRMVEHFYAKSLGAEQYTAASQALALLAKMSGAFHPQQVDIASRLGPVPKDPTQALIYAQKAMMAMLEQVIADPSIDPERKLRWVSEIGGRIGMTYSRTLQQSKLEELARHVLAGGVSDDAGEPIQPGEWNRSRSVPPSGHDARPLPGPGAGSPSGEDEGMDPDGGGEMGPPPEDVH